MAGSLNWVPWTFVCFGCTFGFMCHICSYSSDNDKNSKQGHDCVHHPELLPPTLAIKCGNFCVTSEQWRIKSRTVKSFFRTCSTDWGNGCVDDGWDRICKTSCKGEFCGTKTVGGRHDDYPKKQSNDNGNGSSAKIWDKLAGLGWAMLFMLK